MPHTEPLIAGLRAFGLGADARLLVALSGGPDSTALLVALHEEGLDLVAAHYDHALQPGSAAAAEHVARLCARLGIRLIAERRETPVPRGSIQAGARRLRYDFLVRAADEAGAGRIAMAHTADDVVEGVVMHLLRGCGIAGLRGMPAVRERFVRPLLDVWRADVNAFLERRAITAIDDPANANRRFRRAAARLDLLPRLEASRPGIKRRLRAVARRAAAMQQAIEAAAAGVVESDSIAIDALAAMSEPIAAEILQVLYRRSGGQQPALGRAHVDAMLRLARGGRGGRGLDLPEGRRFRVVDSRAQIVERVVPSSELELLVTPCPGCGDGRAAHLRSGLELRLGHRRPGLRIRPAGVAGTRKLQDVFVDAKVPREDRDAWPLVFAGERLAWVPGLAVDRDLEVRGAGGSLHVTVTRILSAGRSPKEPMLESPHSPRGESS